MKKVKISHFKHRFRHKFPIHQTIDGFYLIVVMQHATGPHRHLSLLRSDNYPARDLYSSFIILYQPQEHKKGCYYPSYISSNIKGNSRALDKRIVLKKNIRQNSRWLNGAGPTEKRLAFRSLRWNLFRALSCHSLFLINDQKKLITFEQHFRKLHVNNSFVFWFTGFSFAFNSFLNQNLKAKRLSCCSPLTALVRRLQGVQVNLAYFSGPPKLRLFKRQKNLPKCCLKIWQQ